MLMKSAVIILVDNKVQIGWVKSSTASPLPSVTYIGYREVVAYACNYCSLLMIPTDCYDLFLYTLLMSLV